MTRNPFFVIIGARNAESATLSVARSAFNIEIKNNIDLDDSYYSSYRNSIITTNLLSIKAETRAQEFCHVEAPCYTEAWQKLLDLWVPPGADKQTRTQILTHFTFNDDQL